MEGFFLGTYINVGGVLWIELSAERIEKSKIDGVTTIAFPIRSSLIITKAIPAAPMFFWAPPNTKPNWGGNQGLLNEIMWNLWKSMRKFVN